MNKSTFLLVLKDESFSTIGFGWKNEIVYWLLKLCRFRILYTFLVFLQVKKEK